MRLDNDFNYAFLFSWLGMFLLGISFYIAIGYCVWRICRGLLWL